jgi:hypothetical protein
MWRTTKRISMTKNKIARIKRDSLQMTKGMQETSIAPTDPLFAPTRTTQTYHFHEAES